MAGYRIPFIHFFVGEMQTIFSYDRLKFIYSEKATNFCEISTVDLCYVVKFIYFEKATQFCEISTLLLSYEVPVKSKVEISQNFVAISEYMNFIALTTET